LTYCRFPASLSADMHGTELRQPDEPSASPLRSPISVFSGDRFNASWRAATPVRPGPDARNGLSLARNGCPLSRPPFRGQCSQPAPSLPCTHLPPPVRLLGSTPPPGLHPVRLASAPPARCGFQRPHRLLLLQPPLPLRSFTSLRIKAFCRIRCLPTRLPILPDLRSLPATVFYC